MMWELKKTSVVLTLGEANNKTVRNDWRHNKFAGGIIKCRNAGPERLVALRERKGRFSFLTSKKPLHAKCPQKMKYKQRLQNEALCRRPFFTKNKQALYLCT